MAPNTLALSLVILPRGKALKNLPKEISLSQTASTSNLHQKLATLTGASIHRIRITKASDGQPIPNTQDIPIQQVGLLDGNQIYVKDLGPQIGWRTTYVVEYLGPLLIHPIFYLLRPYIYSSDTLPFPQASSLQQLTLVLVCLHYTKRIAETMFVHRFSALMMPLRNIFKNCFHYWVLGGIMISYFIYSPTSRIASEVNPLIIYTGLASFVLGELGNLNAHLVLRGLRSSGGRERGIPQGLGFSLITCPHYMFEFLAWIGFSMVSMSWASLFFSIAGLVQMALWANKKENKYRKEFGDRYKAKRFVILPGIY